MSSPQIKFVNFKLSSDNPKEKELIDWLEDRPLKYTFIEALSMYKEKYEAMVQQAKQPTVQASDTLSSQPTEQSVQENPKQQGSNKFLSNLAQN